MFITSQKQINGKENEKKKKIKRKKKEEIPVSREVPSYE